MSNEAILEKLNKLPPEAQREALDFIEFLLERYPLKSNGRKQKKKPLREEPFLGMWKDREDMADSVAWVRKIRKEQWTRNQ